MATIIGRKLEQKELQRLYESDEAEMAVVYGRRRVGKTFLVNQMFGSDGFAFKVTGLYKSRLPKQLENFSLALQEYSGNKDLAEPKSWTEAFDQLKEYLKATKSGKKRVIFFDELPWLDTKGSSFLAAFERFWNGWANAQQDILLIVCGSATNWIINRFFKQKGGLYNRATSKIFLKPFTLNETEQYLEKQGIEWERYDIAQIYMIMGGIPYYLKQLEPNRTLSDNIDNCFFRRNGKLWDEFDNLYETIFDTSDKYLKVVEALSSKHIGLTREQLIKATQLPDNGLISKVLKDLVNCGFVRAYQYYGRKTKTQTYQLADFYTMFYFSFIKDNYAQDNHFWTHSLDTPQKKAWLGYTFEQLVKDHIEQVKRALGIGSVLTKQSSWFEQGRSTDENDDIPGAQIDLLIDRRDKTINTCETKFYSGEFVIDKDYSLKLRNKISTFKAITEPRKTLISTMITTFGIKHNKYSGAIQQEVVLDDLFSQP
ncbi:MAG: ATP-binding protein [Bacteroidales bacterium]|nr:ATP-binding protein [Bacteroidales bacterium]